MKNYVCEYKDDGKRPNRVVVKLKLLYLWLFETLRLWKVGLKHPYSIHSYIHKNWNKYGKETD